MGVKGEYGKWGCDDYWLTTRAINIHSDGLVSPMEYREGWLPSVLLRCVPAVQNVLVSGTNIRPQNILWAAFTHWMSFSGHGDMENVMFLRNHTDIYR